VVVLRPVRLYPTRTALLGCARSPRSLCDTAGGSVVHPGSFPFAPIGRRRSWRCHTNFLASFVLEDLRSAGHLCRLSPWMLGGVCFGSQAVGRHV
jgi:hypothetical protein